MSPQGINSANIGNYFQPGKNIRDFGNVFSVLVPLLVTAGAVLCLVFLLIGAVKYLTAGGTKENIESARKTLWFAIIGFALIFMAFFIVRVITFVTNVDFVLGQ